MSTQPKQPLTPAEYLALERASEVKNEYWRGEMFAMSGASYLHSVLHSNAHFSFRRQLLGRECAVLGSDLRVHVPTTGLFTYPDLAIICGEPQFRPDAPDTVLNPVVILEILSPSAEAYDRGKKFEHYQQISSLLHYVLIAQDRVRVDGYTRQTDGTWLLRGAASLSESIELTAIGCALALADLYAGTRLQAIELLAE